jgi:glutathione-independent formaldehyde dehydrogenase
VDYIPERLDMASRLGAVPVDFRAGDPVGQIEALRRSHGLPPGEEPMNGVDIVIDAVGFQARDRGAPDHENPAQVISDLARLVNPTGHAGIAGVYAEKDLQPVPPYTADGQLTVPWATFFSKGVSVGFGRTHDRRYTVLLRDMILSGRARPGGIVTHHGGLDDAPALYQAFDRRADGVIKAVLHP